MKKRKNVKEIVLAMPFFAVMFYMMIIGFIIPLRPTQSVSEKRNLDKFPSITFSSLVSGTFYDSVSHWFADTFPGRESWITINKAKESLHGFRYNNYIDVNHMAKGDDIPVMESPLAEPAPAASSASPVIAAELPESTPEEDSVVYPTPTSKPFVMQQQETEFESLDPDRIDIEIYSGAIQVGDTVYAAQGFSRSASDYYAEFINDFGDRCAEKGIRLYNVMAPTSVGVLLPDKTRDQLNCADQGKVIEYISAQYDGNVRGVDTYGEIKKHDNEYIFYHTDHHWTGLGAYYGYLAFCKSAGINPVSLDDYERLDEGKFIGSYYSTFSASGKVKSDVMTAYVPPGNVTLDILNYDDEWERANVVLDKTNDSINNKYNTYICGDNKLSVITNEDLPDGPSCLVVKDSFGNPFSIYLSQHYHRVYIVDYRKISSSVMEYAELYNVDDIIICQSIGVSQSRNANGLLKQVLR